MTSRSVIRHTGLKGQPSAVRRIKSRTGIHSGLIAAYTNGFDGLTGGRRARPNGELPSPTVDGFNGDRFAAAASGSTDQITLASASDFGTTGPFSFVIWFRSYSNDVAYDHVIGAGDRAAFRVSDGQFFTHNGGGYDVVYINGMNYWGPGLYRIVVVHTGGENRIYAMNPGSQLQINQNPSNPRSHTPWPVTIGADAENGRSSNLSVYVAHVYKRALSPSEAMVMLMDPWRVFSAERSTTVVTPEPVRRIYIPRHRPGTVQPQGRVQINSWNPITQGIDLLLLPQNAQSHGTVHPSVSQRPSAGGMALNILPGNTGNAVTLRDSAKPGAVSFLAVTMFLDFVATTFGSSFSDNGAVMYSQRTQDADLSPTFCITNSGFGGGQLRPWIGLDSAGTAAGWSHPSAVTDNKLYAIAGSLGPLGNGMIAIDGELGSTVYNVAGSYSSNWTGTAVVGGHAQWPATSITPDRDNASQQMQMFVRWSRQLSGHELSSVTRNPWQILAVQRRSFVGAAVSSVTVFRPSSTIAVGGWDAFGAATHHQAVNEAARNDSSYVGSPNLADPITFGIGPVDGAVECKVAARRTLNAGSVRLNFLNVGGSSVGFTAWQGLTDNWTEYNLSATLSGSASQVRIEVQP